MPRALLAVGLGASISSSGVAQAEASFTVTANTTGVSVVAFNEGFPLVQSLQVSVPSAIASLNSRGQGTAYSASPDPGQDFSELPSALSGAGCTSAPIPGCATVLGQFPAYPTAYAQSGEPPRDVTLGAVQLHAEASTTTSTARSTVGQSGEASASSTAHTQKNPDSSVDGSATTQVDGLTLAGYLHLSGVTSSASLHQSPDGVTTTASSFAVGTIDVDGQSFGFRDGGFSLAGTLVPFPVPTQTVLDALKVVGVGATFLPAEKTANGITSAGLMLTYVVPGPPSGLVPPLPALPIPIGVGLPSTSTTVTYTLGRASVTGSHRAIATTPGGLVGGDLTGPSAGPSPTTSSTPSVGTSSQAPGLVGPDLGSYDPSTEALPTGVDLPQAEPAPAVVAGGPTPAAIAGYFTADSADIYLALVVAALAALGGATAIRYLGVRRAWTS